MFRLFSNGTKNKYLLAKSLKLLAEIRYLATKEEKHVGLFLRKRVMKMAKFVKLKNGNYINADMIVEIEKVTNGKYTSYEVYMRELLTENVSQEELSNILKAKETLCN